MHELVTFFHRFWGNEAGDADARIVATEQRLGVALPRLLREVYLNVALREGPQHALLDLDEIFVDEENLVFAQDDYQSEPATAVRVVDCTLDNPQCGDLSLHGWLIRFCLLNRCDAPPCLSAPLPVSEALVQRGWDQYCWDERYPLAGSCWVKGSVVASATAVGAHSLRELRACLADLGLPRDLVASDFGLPADWDEEKGLGDEEARSPASFDSSPPLKLVAVGTVLADRPPAQAPSCAR